MHSNFRNTHSAQELHDPESAVTQLRTSNPALLLALQNEGHLSKRRSLTSADLLALRQRDLCGILGVPATESSVRIFKKLNGADSTPEAVSTLTELLRSEAEKHSLTHLPQLNTATLEILCTPSLRALTSHRFLTEISALDSARSARQHVRRLKNFAAKATRNRLIGPWAQPLQSISELDARITEFRECERVDFPSPPLDLPPPFHPIQSIQDLLIEARTQRSCVAAHIGSVLDGKSFIYRLSAPERATVALRYLDEQWLVEEIKGPKNRTVDWRTEEYVHLMVEAAVSGSGECFPIPRIGEPEIVNYSTEPFRDPAPKLPAMFEPLTSPRMLSKRGHLPDRELPLFIENIHRKLLYAYRFETPFEGTLLVNSLSPDGSPEYDGIYMADPNFDTSMDIYLSIKTLAGL